MYKPDKMRIEDALIPAVIQSLIFSHIDKDPEVKDSYQKALGITSKVISENINTPKLKKRLYRVGGKITKYMARNEFVTRKGFLAVSEWTRALLEAEALIINPQSEFFQLLEDMGEIIQSNGYGEIEDFDKIDASAISHVPMIHSIAQQEGYFL